MADRIGSFVREIPVRVPVSEGDVRLAVHAVVRHVADGHPPQARCGRDGQPYPCRLGRWGRRVLLAAGVRYSRILDLAAGGDPYAWPLS
ncbi:MAG TPA: hypothetical protein VGD43_02175 [Micromonospora sp.]